MISHRRPSNCTGASPSFTIRTRYANTNRRPRGSDCSARYVGETSTRTPEVNATEPRAPGQSAPPSPPPIGRRPRPLNPSTPVTRKFMQHLGPATQTPDTSQHPKPIRSIPATRCRTTQNQPFHGGGSTHIRSQGHTQIRNPRPAASPSIQIANDEPTRLTAQPATHAGSPRSGGIVPDTSREAHGACCPARPHARR